MPMRFVLFRPYFKGTWNEAKVRMLGEILSLSLPPSLSRSLSLSLSQSLQEQIANRRRFVSYLYLQSAIVSIGEKGIRN